MTEPLFFDTDCISAFLLVNNESILSKLFPGRIVIPKEVYDELSHPSVNRVKGLKAQVDLMLQAGNATIESIMVGTDTYELYRKLTSHPDPGHKIIGRGEAASISLAKEKQGILASNNLRDISAYVTEYGLSHLTTGDIMKMAFDAGGTSTKHREILSGLICLLEKGNLDIDHFQIILQSISPKNHSNANITYNKGVEIPLYGIDSFFIVCHH